MRTAIVTDIEINTVEHNIKVVTYK